jgi:hypothetical protein
MKTKMKRLWIIVLPVCLAACAQFKRADDSQGVPHRILVHHPGFLSDEPKAYTLYQVKDKRGFPSGYTMVVDSVVCPEETCRISTVNMVWDAVGHYQRYDLPLGVSLEKGVPADKNTSPLRPVPTWNGVPFAEKDYQKLDVILKDAHSLLGQQKLSGLVGSRTKDLVDGITGATPATIRDAVVEGASLTCYNLWHWANGEVAEIAKELTHQQCSETMLRGFLSSDKPHYVLFALDHLKRHKLFSPSVVREVNRVMCGGDHDRIDQGLAYLKEALPDRDPFYEDVGAVINGNTSEGRIHLLNRMASERALPARFFETLGAGFETWNSYYAIHLFLRLAEKQGYVSQSLNTQVAKLLENPDFFIARRAYWYLSKQTALDAPTTSRIQAFCEKAAREGRSL